jgi:hypothetical protein
MGLFDNDRLAAAKVKLEADMARAMTNGISNTGYNPYAQLGQVSGYSGGSVTSGTTITDNLTKAYAENEQLKIENRDLGREVKALKELLSHPDRPVAVSLQALVNSMDMKDVAGRTAPPFNYMTMSQMLFDVGKSGKGYPLDGVQYKFRTRDGSSHQVRVIGLIVEDDDMKPRATGSELGTATYMVPTPALTADKAFEAASDLIAHMVVERVLKKMEIEDGS